MVAQEAANRSEASTLISYNLRDLLHQCQAEGGGPAEKASALACFILRHLLHQCQVEDDGHAEKASVLISVILQDMLHQCQAEISRPVEKAGAWHKGATCRPFQVIVLCCALTFPELRKFAIVCQVRKNDWTGTELHQQLA